MTRTRLIGGAAALLALGAIAAFGYARFAAPPSLPAAGVDLPYECTTCDARQASKKRLREFLQSQQE